MQGKTSVLFGAISIVVVGVILAAFVIMPPSASQAQTETLRQAVDRASRGHNQVLGLMAGPTVKVDGKLPPIFEKKGTEANITVLGARQQNPVIPDHLKKLSEEIKAAIDKAPEARGDAKAAAYSLMGQILDARAQYYLQSAANAAVELDRAVAVIDTGIISVQKSLINIKQIAPLIETRENVASKMKTDAEANVTRLESDIAAQVAIITEQETKRAEYLDAATKYNNEASELRTLSAVAQRDKRLELQEKSFVQEKLANKAGQDTEDAQTKIDSAKSAVALMNIELTSSKASIVSATEVLKGFAGNREAAKGELDKATLAMNKIGKEIAQNAEAVIAACGKVDAAHASATEQYAAALEVIKQCRQYVSGSGVVEAISSEAGILMDKAWAAQAVVSSRQSVEATSVRLKALWETAALEGTPPKTAEMAAFVGKVQSDKNAAADSLAAAAKLYEEATTKADTRFKWSYECRELQARRARHRLTGDADDKTRANLLEQQLEELKGFPYVDSAL